MPNTLLAENTRLREQLALLLEQAHRNEQIMRRHQEFDLKFIGAGSFRELIESVFDTLTESSELDVVTLSLLDPDYAIRRSLLELNIDLDEFPNLLFVEQENGLGTSHSLPHKPLLGLYSEARHGRLFPPQVLTPASLAIMPLVRRGKLIGCISLGSLEGARFTHNLATDFLEHMASIVAICLENVINNERLKQIGLTDPLTGVNNRRYVELRLLEEIGRTCRQGYALSCMYIDIDHFKRINDSIGHQGGDAVLREVASRIKAELRLSDALGRFGGEEFVVLLIDAQLDDALCVAERIRASIGDQPLQFSVDQSLPVTVSIGVATLVAPSQGEAIDAIAQTLVARADSALYRAKQEGRNRVIGSA